MGAPPTVPDRLTAHLHAHESRLYGLAEDLLGIDTSNPPGATAAAVEHLDERLTAAGIETDRLGPKADRPNLLVRIPGRSDRTLLLNGHLDTVPYDRGRWTQDPLGAWVDDRLYGRGATDMKGAVAAMVHVLLAFAETDTRPPVGVSAAFVGDEETAGPAGLRALLDAEAIDAEACVIGEPTCEGDRHSVAVADKGSIWLTLEATGTAAHGSRPPFGVNAIERLLSAIDAIERELEDIRFDLDERVDRIVDDSVPFYAPRIGRDVASALFDRPTVNLGTIEGGQTVNRVPETARAELDIRLSPGVDTPAVLDRLRDVVEGQAGVTIEEAPWSIGTFEPIDAPIVEATATTASAVSGERIYRRSATGGGDAKLLRAAGVSTVEFAFATETAHAVDEYTTAPILQRNASVYLSLPYAYADAVAAEPSG